MANPCGGNNVYVGARYAPVITGEWDASVAYEPLTVVLYGGSSYTSKKDVPSGTLPTNETYWARTGDYNAQVEKYRQEVASVSAEQKKSSRCYDTVEDMVEDASLKPGYVQTLGFYEPGDGGAAWYHVVESPTGDEPNGMDVLQCRKYVAELMAGEWVTPEQFGAKGDGIVDDSESLQRALNHVNVELNGNYLIKKSLTFTSLNMRGNNSEIIIFPSDFEYDKNSIFAMHTTGIHDDISKDEDTFTSIVIHDVVFKAKPSSFNGESRIMLGLHNTKFTIIQGCIFDFEYKSNMSPIDFRGGNINTFINSCQFIINTDNGTDSSGSIQFRAYNSIVSTKNVYITNSLFIKKNVDEFIFITSKGSNKIENINITGCMFLTKKTQNGNMDYAITASGNYNIDVSITDCYFNFEQLDNSVVRVTENDCTIDFKINNCNIYLGESTSASLIVNASISNSIIKSYSYAILPYSFISNSLCINNIIEIYGDATAIFQNSKDFNSSITVNDITYGAISSELNGTSIEGKTITEISNESNLTNANISHTGDKTSASGKILNCAIKGNITFSGNESIMGYCVVEGTLTSYGIEDRVNYNMASQLVGNINDTNKVV